MNEKSVEELTEEWHEKDRQRARKLAEYQRAMRELAEKTDEVNAAKARERAKAAAPQEQPAGSWRDRPPLL